MSRLACWLAALAACGRAGSAELAPTAEPREAKATRGAITERVLLTGRLRAASSTDLNVPKTEAWQLTIRWLADDGILVKAGEKVVELDNSPFTQGLLQKRMQLLEAERALRSFRDLAALNLGVKEFELQQHRIALEKATLLASVPEDLLAQRTAQERQLEKARAAATVAKAERELAAERQASALEGKVKQLELDKARRAIEANERAIEALVLRVPTDGVVLVGTHPWEDRRFQVGDMVQPGFTLATQPDLAQPMKVEAELSDVDDGRVTVGARGTCVLDAYPREPIPCTVEDVAPVARSVTFNSLRRGFAVKLALGTSDPERMRPGMSVKVELPARVVQDALTVPRGALVLDGTAARVRLEDGALRDVRLGACDAQRCAIEDGLAEGQVVVVGGGS